jgi:hypothetical protein
MERRAVSFCWLPALLVLNAGFLHALNVGLPLSRPFASKTATDGETKATIVIFNKVIIQSLSIFPFWSHVSKFAIILHLSLEASPSLLSALQEPDNGQLLLHICARNSTKADWAAQQLPSYCMLPPGALICDALCSARFGELVPFCTSSDRGTELMRSIHIMQGHAGESTPPH